MSSYFKRERGVTVIALIVTIIIVFIIAAVAIGSADNYEIIDTAKDSGKQFTIEQEKDDIRVKVTDWKVFKDKYVNKTFPGFLREKYGNNNVIEKADSSCDVIMESGNVYNVKENAIVSLVKVIYIQAQGMPLILEEGKTVKGTLSAVLSELNGKITWSIANESIATISSTSGESITVTGVSKGETKVTASCSGYKAEYIVKVSAPIEIGGYVEYDVSYTDMYQGTQYTKTNGWRYLGTDDDGNKLLVSTAIPAILYYHYLPGTAPTWWATDAEVQDDTGIYNTTAGWNYNNGGYPSKYAAYGLRYKFESIPFKYQASGTSLSTLNTGIFRQIGSTTSGTNINLNFKANGVKVKDVHNLSLAELNKTVSKVTGKKREESSIFSGFKELTGESLGLFNMQDLTGYTEAYNYWLASPYTDSQYSVCNVKSSSISIGLGGSSSYGVRPVVVLLPDIEIVDTNADGIYEIK